MNKKEFSTWLPVFPGFYGTYFEVDTCDGEFEHIMENGIYISEIKRAFIPEDKLSDLMWDNFDNKEYEKDVCIAACESIENACDLIINIEFENESSPKFYNYSNDSINCKITIDLDALRDWIYENSNKEYLDGYFKERYTSCSGFISSYPNSFKGWELETKNFTELDDHYLGAILNCYFELLDYDSLALYYDCSDKDIYPGFYFEHKKILQEAIDNEFDITYKIDDPNQLKIDLGGVR